MSQGGSTENQRCSMYSLNGTVNRHVLVFIHTRSLALDDLYKFNDIYWSGSANGFVRPMSFFHRFESDTLVHGCLMSIMCVRVCLKWAHKHFSSTKTTIIIPAISIHGRQQNKYYGNLYLWGLAKWRIDESPRFKQFRQKNYIFCVEIRCGIQTSMLSEKERNKITKSSVTNVLFMMRDPQKEQKYRTNVINVMTSNLFYPLFVFIFSFLFWSHAFSPSFSKWDLNTENFLNCGDKSGPIERNEWERESKRENRMEMKRRENMKITSCPDWMHW